jgi:peptidoglycan/LPS O-acetylase OafA/YrhL
MSVMNRELEAWRSLASPRRRAVFVIGVVTLGCLALLLELLAVGHTSGDEIWGVATALSGFSTGALSLILLVTRSRSRAARIALLSLWLTVAFFGFGGYNSHRLALAQGVSDPRPRPPLAPLIFTGLWIAGAIALRSGSKGK